MATRARPSRSRSSAPRSDAGARPSALELRSPSFEAGGPIPVRFTSDGQNLSPTLTWGRPPEGTKVLALLCEDPDAPTPNPFVHWLVANIDPGQSGRTLNEGAIVIPGAVLGKTSFGRTGYGGPEPPRGHGTHHYHFKLYALNASLPLAEGFSKEDLLEAMKGRVLAAGELVGTYRR